jgi:stalled ribosome rescue protein Dom34
MTYAHAIVWLDHQHATVIDFTVDDRHVSHVESTSPRKLHRKSGPMGTGKAPEDAAFFDEVVAAVAGAHELVVCGPGTAKVAFMHHLERKHQRMVKQVLGVETLDHPSDGELLAFARRYFRRADALLGDA